MEYSMELLTLLDKFTVFPKLPLEIRRKIWRESAEERVVTVKDASTWVDIDGTQTWVYGVKGGTYTLPTMMLVSQESRAEGNTIYHWTFGQRLGRPAPFNFSLDTLLIDGPDGASNFNTFIDSPNIKDHYLAHEELKLMQANLQTLIIAGDDMYLYTSADVAGFYNLRLICLPWKNDGNDNQLRAWMQGIWQRRLLEAKAQLTAKLEVKQAAIEAAAEEEKATKADTVDDDDDEKREALRKAETKKHILAIEEGIELQRLRKAKTEVMFTNGLGVEAWLGEGIEITKAVVKTFPTAKSRI
ncbi:uncharacterized protein RAG0_10852 [Rhynchosporium agropyri]|uniref:2EXR domain-containing protein n=1 Tax=Rhynchosporium agropyri TaxID=914238 RepID=A0A1E1L1K5_9HELO|nr:uncharacterized protein RAG0_10852 [Rhynchosporium agropyri]